MLANNQTSERISCYCALCISRCGSVAVVENGRFLTEGDVSAGGNRQQYVAWNEVMNRTTLYNPASASHEPD